MPKPITATELRSNVYRILDEVIETGVVREVTRGGEKVMIVPASPRLRDLSKRKKRRAFSCSVEDLVGASWETEWASEP